MTKPLTDEQRAEREARRQKNRETWLARQVERDRGPIKAARSQEHREAWLKSELNSNYRKHRYENEMVPLPEITAEVEGESGSLAKLRAVMADDASPLFRRLDAADVIIDFELAPGAAAGVAADQLASSAFQFYRAVEANPAAPEALKFRALKSIARIENSRKQAAQSPEAHFANREFARRQVNTARSTALRAAGVWRQVVASRASWALKSNDVFDVPELPQIKVGASVAKDGVGVFLDALNRQPHEQKEQRAAERNRTLLAVRATNREDNWDQLLPLK